MADWLRLRVELSIVNYIAVESGSVNVARVAVRVVHLKVTY